MKYTITEQLLLFLADWQDTNRRFFSWRLAWSIPGDPRLRKYRGWLERQLLDKRKRKKMYNAMQSLKRGEFLKDIDNSGKYILTFKGKLKTFKIKSSNVKKRKMAKENYLIVFFDIPEQKRKVRDTFRSILINLGFWQLQKSVWLTNYNVSEELKELIKNFNLEKQVYTFLVKGLSK